MAVKLKELYTSFKEKDIKLVAGEKGVDNIVRWVHMVEGIEISLFLEKQELALTTGIALKREGELFELVKRIHKSNASGMVINIGPFIKKIPEEIIKFCNKNDFPLFEVPWEVYLAEMMRSFCYQITLSERVNLELSSAVKNAIFFGKQTDLYVPQLEMHNFNVEWHYCIAVVEVLNKNGENIASEKKRSQILKTIENVVTYTYKNTFVFELENKFVLVFAEHKNEEIDIVIKRLRKRFHELFENEYKVYFSIGEKVKNIYNIGKSYRKAVDVLKIQKRKKNYVEVMKYSQLGIYKLLLSIDDKDIINEYYLETVQPLIEYDELNGTDFTIVLSSYLKNSCSVKEVAEQLFYHRNTINYKINKIQEILSCDLSKLETRVLYSIALMLHEIM